MFHLGDRIAAGAASGTENASVLTQRVAVVGAVTIDYLWRAVACAVASEGVLPIMYRAPFGAHVQEILDPSSTLYSFAPELIVISPSQRDLITALSISASESEVASALSTTVALFQNLWTTLAEHNIRIIQHLLVPPADRFRGLADRIAAAAPASQICLLNKMLLEAGRGLVHFVDLAALASQIGSRRWAAARFHHTARLDFDPRHLPGYLAPFRAAWRAANSRIKKVLVLDLDNTLWGGVIGDDGLDGIALGPSTPVGEAFEDWQRMLKGLADRGVVLAVCSKNDPEIAATGFTHPHSVLHFSDFAAFECSWSDKVGGLRRIAQALNLGLDCFVFADDNPAECSLVRQELPDVAVVHLGDDPEQFAAVFDAGYWFDLAAYTPEDLGRSAAYTARASALAERAEATDVDRYLAGLAMKGRLYRPEEGDIARVAQIEQKTNQFNLTTRRYSEAAIRGFLAREDAVVLAFRLADRFGDHGLVSTLIGFREGDSLRIDSWLMSCRVFSRSAEQYIMGGLVAAARAQGANGVVGEYLPTAKNDVVAGLYPRLGFAAAGRGRFVRDCLAPIDDLVTQISVA
jgi:FkbH-like protein